MKRLIVLLFAYLITCAYSNEPDKPPDDHSSKLFEARVELKSGRLFAPSTATNTSGDNEGKPIHVPSGARHGPISPKTPQVRVAALPNPSNSSTEKRWCSSGDIQFSTITTWGKNSAFFPPDPSGATSGAVVFAVSNTFASFSLDGGVTFTNLDSTKYSGPPNPPTHNGLWGDQIVLYIPDIDRFVWLMQYYPSASNTNMLRLVIFKPDDVDQTGIPSGKWSFIDLTSATFNLGNNYMDYPDLSYGDNFLYVSVDKIGSGLFVSRIPLAALTTIGSFTFQYTPVLGDAQGAHVSQNTGDAVFWAGHHDLSTLRVYRIHEGTNILSFTDVAVNPYLNGDYKSLCRDNQDWLNFGFPRDAVIGTTRRTDDEVWFAWSAGRGEGFPNPYIPVVQINTGNWPSLSVNRQWEIWNPDFSFAYPALTTNECGDVGIALGFGGGKPFATSAVGIADARTGILANTVWYASSSTQCNTRWGDFLTVRIASPDGSSFASFIYSVINSDFVRQYVLFGR